jgi:predicted nucleic acid-binding protein
MPKAPMIIINSSPAINLVRALESLELLPLLYGDVIVPLEVIHEVDTGREKDLTAQVLRQTLGVKIRSEPTQISPFLAAELDTGEAAVIEIALREGFTTVLLDDLKARRVAKLMGLNVTGSLGTLVQAKRTGHIGSLRPLIKRMRDSGTWLDDTIIGLALKLAGES